MEGFLSGKGPSLFWGMPQGRHRRPSFIYEGRRVGEIEEVQERDRKLEKIFEDFKSSRLRGKLPPRKKSSITKPGDDSRKSSEGSIHRKISVPAVSLERSTDETERLRQDSIDKSWKTWGPYLSERQWGTVREDYSHDGNWSVTLAFYPPLNFLFLAISVLGLTLIHF